MENTTVRDNRQVENEIQEIIGDFYPGGYPNDRRSKVSGASDAGRYIKKKMSNNNKWKEHDRRVLTYDFYPNDRRRSDI